jgi:hypothetical protein
MVLSRRLDWYQLDINPLLTASAKDHSALGPGSPQAPGHAADICQMVQPPSQTCDSGPVVDVRKRPVTLIFGSSGPIDLLLKAVSVSPQDPVARFHLLFITDIQLLIRL